jgi:hypothetical protein
MTSDITLDALPLACDMTAIPPHERGHHAEVARALFTAAAEMRDLPDGHAFRLPADTRLLTLAAEFIARERLCCPFFTFTLEIAPVRGPVWLRITGPAGAKEVLAAELGELVGKAPEMRQP